MIRIESTDLADLEAFALKWRWTDERYAAFSHEELSRIRPLRPEKAEEMWKHSLRTVSKHDFAIDFDSFEDSERAPATDGVASWLASKLPLGRVPIVVSWQPAFAVLTDAELFVQRWDDFCYPASDAVSVHPLDDTWVLHYHHEEEFLYALRRPTG